MRLTVQIERQPDGRFKGFFKEIPAAFFVAETETTVRERLERLEKALQSPHIKVERVMPDGEIIMTLDRRAETEPEVTESAPKNGKNGARRHYMTLSEAMIALGG